MVFKNDDFIDVELDPVDGISGHRLHEMAQMNPPEDNLGDDIEIWVCGESADKDEIIEPHFHVCKDRTGDGYHYAVDIEVKIRDIVKMTIWRSKTGHLTWDGLSKLYNTVLEWLNKKAFDTDISNKEAIRQEWNRCNIPNRVKREEL